MEKVEIWIPIQKTGGLYSVSNLGRIMRNSSGKTIKQHNNSRGYKFCYCCVYGQPIRITVHREVALAFIPNASKPFVNHINGIKNDNRPENLEWVTAKENTAHAISTGLISQLGDKNKMSKLTKNDVINIRNLINIGIKQKEIADIYKVQEACISAIKHKRNWGWLKEDL